MKTVLYLDELLLVNFALGAALLLGAGLLAGRSCTGARLLAGSGAAACSMLCKSPGCRARCAAYRSRKWNGPPFRPWAAHRRPAFPS